MSGITVYSQEGLLNNRVKHIRGLLLSCLIFGAGCASAPVTQPATTESSCPRAEELGANVRCSDDVKDLGVMERDVAMHSAGNPDDRILVVFDIDDTLLTSTQFFGGDRWFRWQDGDPVNTDDGQTIIIDQDDVLQCIYSKLNALYELARFRPTQEDAHEIVARLQKNHSVTALTSRAPGARTGTERELERAGMNLATSHLMPLDHSLHYQMSGRGVSYANGIVMSTGLDKGIVLDAVLTKVGKSYDAIFFIDDGAENLANVNAFWKDRSAPVRLYHYTRIDKAVTNRELADAVATNRKLNDFLKSAYPDRRRDFGNDICN